MVLPNLGRRYEDPYQGDGSFYFGAFGFCTSVIIFVSINRFFPAIKAGADRENWENQIEDFICLKDSEMSFSKIDLRKYYIHVLTTKPEDLSEKERALLSRIEHVIVEENSKFSEYLEGGEVKSPFHKEFIRLAKEVKSGDKKLK